MVMPDQGCSWHDRAIVQGSDPGADALLSSLMTAMGAKIEIQLRVDGCAVVNPDESTNTAPRITKVQLMP